MKINKEKKQKGIAPFIHKLFLLLQNPSNESSISWTSQSNTFMIKDVVEFTRVVLPEYYKHSNLSSFVRQLNIYGFKKTKVDSTEHIYFNTHFNSNCKTKLRLIKRRRSRPIKIINKNKIQPKKEVQQNRNIEIMNRMVKNKKTTCQNKDKQTSHPFLPQVKLVTLDDQQKVQNCTNLIIAILKTQRTQRFPQEQKLYNIIKTDLYNGIPYERILCKIFKQLQNSEGKNSDSSSSQDNLKNLQENSTLQSRKISQTNNHQYFQDMYSHDKCNSNKKNNNSYQLMEESNHMLASFEQLQAQEQDGMDFLMLLK